MLARALASLLVGILAVQGLTEQQLQEYLQGDFEKAASESCNRALLALWDCATDVGNTTKEVVLEQETLEYAKFKKDQWGKYFKPNDWKNIKNPQVKRQMKLMSVLGIAALDEASISELNKHLTTMSNVYSLAKICPFKNQNCNMTTEGLTLDPEIETIMAKSKSYDELLYLWIEWRKATGAKMRHDYKKYVFFNNEAAKENGFNDMGEMWQSHYESDNLKKDLHALWEQVKPLYLELHTYVSHKLRNSYGSRLGEDDGLLPAHIFGNMWAQNWINIYELVRPYPKANPVNIRAALKEKNHTALKMFETANDFYKSLGLADSQDSFDESKGAIITKPEDMEIECQASAWDFCDSNDFRIKMCTKINAEDFVTVHHEMGHIQYYMQYQNLPYAFRKGANPGFHEAVGDTIALSVSTPYHLQKIGLLNFYNISNEDDLNALMLTALDKIAFLPFGLLVDTWRWDVFSGTVKERNWNFHWWKLREEFQKVKAPVRRTEDDFDPGAKYHVPNDSQYIAYFVASILQFQLHKALCIAAKQYDPNNENNDTLPLHKCDIYGSDLAGKKLQLGLQQGGSQHWTQTLYLMTGEKKLDGSALLEYFKPLHEYLQEENKAYRRRALMNFMPIIVTSVFAIVILLLIVAYFMVKNTRKYIL